MITHYSLWLSRLCVVFPLVFISSFVHAQSLQPTNPTLPTVQVSFDNVVRDGVVRGAEAQVVNPALGSWSVTPQGSASGNIPLELPAGRGGVQPQLSLTYDSNLGDGLMGMGWRLSSIPVIQRVDCGGGINYDGEDDYAFNPAGWEAHPSCRQKLVRNDRDAHPRHFYQTVRGSWMRFFPKTRPVGTCGDGPCYWEVQDGQGNTYWFGGSRQLEASVNDSFHPAGPVPPVMWHNKGGATNIGTNGRGIQSWHLFQVRDLHGNYYTITYHYLIGTLYPKEMKYTLHDRQSLPGYHRVEFGYHRRSSVSPPPNQFEHLLKEVRVFSNKTGAAERLVRKYVLNYEQSRTSGLPRLRSVVKQGSDGTSLPPYSFVWKDARILFESTATSYGIGVSRHFRDDRLRIEDDIPTRQLIGDVNGDGRDDLVTMVHDMRVSCVHSSYNNNCQDLQQNHQSVHVWYSDGNGLGSPEEVALPAIFENQRRVNASERYRRHARGVEQFNTWPVIRPGDYTLGDINADGIKDLILFHYSDEDYGRAHLFYALGSAAGLSDFVAGPMIQLDSIDTLRAGTVFFRPANVRTASDMPAIGGVHVWFGDVNGDGKTDVVVGHKDVRPNVRTVRQHITARFYIAYANGNGFDAARTHETASGCLQEVAEILPMDIDGDGKMDLVCSVIPFALGVIVSPPPPTTPILSDTLRFG